MDQIGTQRIVGWWDNKTRHLSLDAQQSDRNQGLVLYGGFINRDIILNAESYIYIYCNFKTPHTCCVHIS